MVIQHNISSMNANRQYGISTGVQAKASEKLQSGYRINRGADDAAGLAISEKMRRQISGLNQASFNCQDAISLVQVCDGALSEVHDLLQRGSELSVKAANDTLTEDDRKFIQADIDAILEQIDSIRDSTSFNEIKVLKGGVTGTNYDSRIGDPTEGGAYDLVIQAGSESDHEVGIKLTDLDRNHMGLINVDVTGPRENLGPEDAITKFKDSLFFISQERSRMGAYQNRFEHTIRNLNTTQTATLIKRKTPNTLKFIW